MLMDKAEAMDSVSKPIIQRAEILGKRWQEWIHQSHEVMEPLIEAQVDQSGHTRADVVYQLKHLAEAITPESLRQWVQKSWLTTDSTLEELKPTDVVCCIHAGNLPMVGLQDMLAVALSGGFYAGKISRRDASLMCAWLSYLQDHEPYFSERMAWSTEAKTLMQRMKGSIKAWIFTGNESTWEAIKSQWAEPSPASQSTYSTLIRRAEASIVLLEDNVKPLDPSQWKALAESMLRYQGKGCRSVGLILSAHPLTHYQQSCAMVDSLESVLMKSMHDGLSILQERQMERAWCAANQIAHVWVDHLLIREAPEILFEEKESLFSTIPGVVYWVQGNEEMISSWLKNPKKAAQIQSVYTAHATHLTKQLKRTPVEQLETAQQPPIDWTPDGENPLTWLLSQPSKWCAS